MWKKRACSILLALMVAMTAIPFSAVPVYSQEAETMQDASDTEAIGEEEVLMQEPAQAAEEAVEEETDTEDVSASDAQSQEEEKEQEEAVSSDEAAAEDDEAASEVGQRTDTAAEDTDDGEKAVEEVPDTAEESSPEADSDNAPPSGQADEPSGSDEVITAEPAAETVSEDAMAEGQNEQYRVDLVSRDGKTIVCPGEEIVLDAHVYRDPDGSAVSSGLKYKWEIVKGIDGGYVVLDDNIEGVVGDYPSATLKFSGVPDPDSEAFRYEVTVKVTVYDGKDSGTELTSGTIDTLLLDEYFEITPQLIDQIPVGEERTIPISIRCCGYYYDSFRYGYEVAWRFTYDENVLELTDPDGNILDGTGTEPYEPGDDVNEPEITIRRLSGEWSDLKAEATFSYIDHNGVVHSKQNGWQDTFSKDYHFDAVENPDDAGGRIWFDINENRIFSDGTYLFDLHTEDIPEEYDVQVKVGHYDDSGLVEAYTEGKEYGFDGSKLTLYGQQIYQRGYHWFEMEVQAVSRQDGHILCGNGFGFESREARAEYDFAEDKDMLTGWYATVNHWERVYVENAGNPNGMDLSYETTNVSIVSQDPVESGKEVLDIEVHYQDDDTSSDNYWWHYEAISQGTAVMRVDYKDIDGNAQSYTFDVYVKGDVYGVHVFTEDGSTVTRPGGTINLLTEVEHKSEDEEREGVTDNLVYAWNLKAVDGNPDPENFASLQESDGGKQASVTFSAPADFEDQWFELEAEVFIYTDSLAEENKVGYDSIRLSMADSYTELWPAQIDSYADVGTSQTITAEFRIYPGSDGREYDLVSPEDGTVTYYWHYDDNAFRVCDKDGKQVGNDDESGAYIGSDACTGSACDFTIYRKRQWDTDIFLDACWRDANGEEHWENRHFHMDERYYRVWADVEDDRIFSDGTASYPVIVDGLREDAVYGVDYNIDLKIGPLGDNGISDTFTEGVEYTFDGHTLTFDGQKLAAYGLEDDQMFGADITLIIADEEVWVENRDFRFREARTDFDREYDRDMLTGWDGTVNGSYHVRVENSENKDGYDADYRVLDVKVISDEPWEGEEGPVIDDFHRDQNEDDPSDYWWYYHVENRGKATLEVTYEDLDGQEQKYTFDLYVGNDVYRVHIDSVDKDRQGLPGDEFELFADGHHEYYDENGEHKDDSEGFDYQWKIEEGSEFARLEVDQDNPAKALLCLNEELPEGRDWIDEMIRVSVRILDKDGNETGGYDESNFWVKSEFYEIWPLDLNPDLEMGDSIENVEFETRLYSSDRENYEVIDDRYDVHYEWYFDENALAIASVKDGEETAISDGETAEGNTFTITRKADWHTDYSVRAFWTQGQDDERDAWGNYWINQKNYEIRFFNEEDTIRSDETKSFAIDTSGLGDFKPDIFMFVNYQSREGEIDDPDNFTDMTEGVEYTVDPSGTSVTVDGKLVEKKLTESAFDKDRFYIGAAMIYDGSPYKFFKFCRVELERGDKEEQEISASDLTISMYDTAAASVDGAQGTLTFTSGNTDVVTVDAETGELTPVAPGTAQITVDAAETDEYLAASTTFTVTVVKLDLKNATFKGTLPSGGFIYDGTPKIPGIELTYNGIRLEERTDYTLSFTDNINAGNVRMRLTGTGKCSGTIERSYLINRASISEAQVEGFEESRVYSGEEQVHSLTVKLGDKVLRRNSDYSVHYRDNVNVGTATVDIIGMRNYTEGKHLTFTITPASIENAGISDIPDQVYTGSALEPAVTVTLDGKTLTSGTDYTVSYSSNTNAGTAAAAVTGKGNYTGTAPEKQFTISAKSITDAVVDEIPEQTYTGSALEPAVTVTLDGKTLVQGTDYTVEYKNNTDPGTAAVTVTGKGNYTGTVPEKQFTIIDTLSIEDASVTGISNRTYNGAAQTQTPVVKLGSKTLAAGTDYTVSYRNNTNAGTAAVIITGTGSYTGTVSRNFTIAKATQSFKVSAASVLESGKTAKITASGAKETSKYNFASSNTGIATVSADGTVTGRNPGTVVITVSTAATANYNAASWPVKITVNKVLKKPGYCHFVRWNNKNYTGCRIAWNRAVGAEGYETHLCWTNGSHSSITTVGPNVLYRDCKVYPNHVSVFHVRAFYTLNGQKVYGPWSNMEFITPSPTRLTCTNVSSGGNLQMKVSWPIIYGCNGYNVFITTNPNGKWSWNQSTAVRANALSAVITKYQGGKLKKNTRYYVRIVTRRKFKNVFCSVPMPASNTYVGSFVIK